MRGFSQNVFCLKRRCKSDTIWRSFEILSLHKSGILFVNWGRGGSKFCLTSSGFSLSGLIHPSTENHSIGSRTHRPQETSATRHFGITKLVPKFKPNRRWSCRSSELSCVEVSRLFLDHGTRVEVSRTTFLVSKCLEIGAEVFQSVLMPKCFVAERSGNHSI